MTMADPNPTTPIPANQACRHRSAARPTAFPDEDPAATSKHPSARNSRAVKSQTETRPRFGQAQRELGPPRDPISRRPLLG